MNSFLKPRTLGVGIVLVSLVALLLLGGNLLENVDADEILVVQSPIAGTLTWHTQAGIKWQGLGKVTKYSKRKHFEFGQPIRFNDAGKADIAGSVQWEMPLDTEHLTELHTKYGSSQAVEQQLVAKSVTKAVYMTGPLMSSRESYAEKRPKILNYIQDQVENGIFATKQKTEKAIDPLSGEEKTITITEILQKEGRPLRQERMSALSNFGIGTFNFTVDRIDYEDRVQKQIAKQQEMTMEVQTAIAAAKQAEQQAITAEEQGKANVMTAKYEKEVEKVKEVTEAEKKRDVAELDKEAADFKKQELILLGQGEGERKRLVMKADGALQQKLDALVKINARYAQAMENYKGDWVPRVQMGQNGTNGHGANGAMDLVNLLTIKTAKDLSLDMEIQGNK